MSNELMELQRELSECRRVSDRRRRYPTSLKERVVRYARARREQGERMGQVAGVLGMKEKQLYEWSREYGRGAFHEVTVVESRAPMVGRAPGVGTSAGLRLVSPGGWRVEGLDLDELAFLLSRVP